MLDLNKTEPLFFTAFKNKYNPTTYEDCSDRDFKNNLRNEILKEQNGQCFYCENKINNNTENVHIDHIKQQGRFHTLICSYNNMVLSCNKKEHCGKYKDTQGVWDDTKYIKLVGENIDLPSEFFNYMNNGKIKPKKELSSNDKSRASNTIAYLNLNHTDLNQARRVIFMQIESYGAEIDKNSLFEIFNEFQSIFKK